MNRMEIIGTLIGLAMFMLMMIIPPFLENRQAHEITMAKLKMGCPVDDK